MIMSSRSTIFLTNDNEHCYLDGSYELNNQDEYVSNFIDLEMSKANIKVVIDDKNDLVVRIFKGSELYEKILSIDK